MKKILYTALVAVFTLSSCNKNEDQPHGNSNFPADGVIRVNSGVATRAGVTTENLTEFGFCVTNSVNTNYSYDNIKMTKTTDVWSSASQMLWQNATQTVDFVAYAPYQSAVAYTTTTTEAVASVLADQSTADNIKASDFIAERKSAFNPSNDLVNGKVQVAMNHLMSKLNLTIELGTEFNKENGTAINPISAITINGFIINGSCNFTATPLAVVSKSGATAKSITPFASVYTAGEAETKRAVANYECILVPQEVAAVDFSISFTIGSKDYTWTASNAVTLAGGKEYELKLTAGKDIVTAGSMSSSEWIEGTGGNIATE